MSITFNDHFSLMAAYNRRMNQQVYATTSNLTTEQQNEDRGAYFGSVFATLNHILTGDLLWLERFQNHPARFPGLGSIENFPAFESLDQIAFSDFSQLTAARENLDQVIIDWIENDISEADYSDSIEYRDTRDNRYRRNFAELLAHFFNHQTHHRGQISTLLMQFGYDIGITDFLIDIPSE